MAGKGDHVEDPDPRGPDFKNPPPTHLQVDKCPVCGESHSPKADE
jgi:hypothetical protein